MDPSPRPLTPFGRDYVAAQDRRRRYLALSSRAFAELGLARATMEDAARAIGISKVYLYRHFPTKDALIRAILQDTSARLLAVLDAMPRVPGAGLATLLTFVRSDPHGAIMLLDQAPSDPAYRAIADEFRAMAVQQAKSLVLALVPGQTDPRFLDLMASILSDGARVFVLNWIRVGSPERDAEFLEWASKGIAAQFHAWNSERPLPLG